MIVGSGEQAATHQRLLGKPCVDAGLAEGASGRERECDKDTVDKDSQESKGARERLQPSMAPQPRGRHGGGESSAQEAQHAVDALVVRLTVDATNHVPGYQQAYRKAKFTNLPDTANRSARWSCKLHPTAAKQRARARELKCLQQGASDESELVPQIWQAEIPYCNGNPGG